MCRYFHWTLILSLGLTACATPSLPGSVTPASGILHPYATATPTLTPTPWLGPVDARLSTPTPMTYVVVQGDTFHAIAARFGITLEALMAANPGILSSTLPVGTILKVPVGSSSDTGATPTPVPLVVVQTNCYPSADGGLWCLLLVLNDYADTLENLSAQVTLLDVAGQIVTSQVAFAPLDILPPGRVMPLAVFFPPPGAVDWQARAQILTSIRLLPDDARYLPAWIGNTLVSVDGSGRTSQVTGQVNLPAHSAAANRVWVLGVAYDDSGNAVGLRKWESTAVVQPGGSLPFNFSVSSLGPPIARVDVLVEARP